MNTMRNIYQPTPGQVIGVEEYRGRNLFADEERHVQKWVITDVQPETLTLERQGQNEAFARRSLSSRGKTICWGEGVPDVDETCLGPILTLLEKSSYSRRAFLLAVRDVTDEQALCDPIYPDRTIAVTTSEADESEMEAGSEEETDKALNVSLNANLPNADTLKAGDVVLVTISATANDPETLRIEDGAVALTGLTIGEAERLSSSTRRPFGVNTWPIGGRDEMQIEWGYHLAKHDEDVIVVFSHTDGKGAHTSSISHKGSKLYWVDSINDDLWSMSLGEGIWIGRDISWHDAGEDGAEWDASWSRATVADLKTLGLSRAEIVDHVTDTLERPVSDFELKSMLATGDWHDAYRTMDEAGEKETAGAIAREWIEQVGRMQHTQSVSLQEHSLLGGGTVLSLYRYASLIATATIIRDDMNFSILTRWLDPEIAEQMRNHAFEEWITGEAGK